jgi:hypothetical protein
MTLAVVLGSDNDPRFAVTNFPPTGQPSTVFVNPGFPEIDPPPANPGCVVACSRLLVDGDLTSSLAAVGQYGGGYVAIYDLNDPAAPQQLSKFDTGLGTPHTGIGALSLYGTNLVVGELDGSNIVYIDITNPRSPSIVSTVDFADGGISAIVLNGSTAVVSGSLSVAVVDYTNARHPHVGAAYPPSQGSTFQFLSPTTCDFDGSSVVVADSSGNVYLFEVDDGSLSKLGQTGSALEGITSITVQTGDITQVAAGNFGEPQVDLISLGDDPNASGYQLMVGSGPGDAGGAVAFYGFSNLFASTNNGQGITWFNTMSWPNWKNSGPPVVRVAKNANLAPASISTLGVANFKPSRGRRPPPRRPKPRAKPSGSRRVRPKGKAAPRRRTSRSPSTRVR